MNLTDHLGHKPTITQYGNTIEMECSCGEILIEQEATSRYVEQVETNASCSMEDGCLSCGS